MEDNLDLDQFCLDNGIDEEAGNQLKELDSEMQQEVLGRGPLSDARNPSAVLLSRIRQLRNGGAKRKTGVSRDELHREIEDFVRENNLDERANTCLMESEEEVLRQLFATPLTDARNPSAVVLTRIRQIKDDINRGSGRGRSRGRGGRRGERSGRMERETEDFIRDNDLDDRASRCLRDTEDKILEELFNRGSLTHAENASAMALFRIRQIKEDIQDGRIKSRRDDRGDRDYDDKGKGKGKGDDWWWYMPPWALWGGKGDWDSWGKGGKGDWDSWGKGGKGDWDSWGKGKGSWDEGKGKGKGSWDEGKGKGARKGPY